MAGLRSLYFDTIPDAGATILLDIQESRHLLRVLRVRPGEPVEVLNGKGAVLQTTFQGESGKQALLKVESVQMHPPRRPGITLLQAIPKGKTFDSILRQSVEIGVSKIIPLMTSRTEVRLSNKRLEGKYEHWSAVIREAGKQSGNPFFPELAEPTDLSTALDGLGEHFGLVGSLEPHSVPLLNVFPKNLADDEAISIAVGPEGDFSPEEYKSLYEAQFHAVQLAQQVLKCDTAALYLVSTVDAWLARDSD